MDGPDPAILYRRWAEIEARGSSPCYERLASAVATSPAALQFLASLPRRKRQPNLLLAALRWFEAPIEDPNAALDFLDDHAQEFRALMLARSTQTNEAARCAVLLPALALLGEPLVILEIGSSAGLCLLMDTWGYDWTDAETGALTRLGSGRVRLPCTVTGSVPLPAEMPAVAARMGLDSSPLDVTDPAARRWLQCLIWPEHTERAERLARALDRAAATPPPLRQGTFPEDVPSAVEQLRRFDPGATVVVMHGAAAAYLDTDGRRRLTETLTDLDVHRLSLEGAEVSRDLGVRGIRETDHRRFILGLDGRALASADPHGRDLHWWV